MKHLNPYKIKWTIALFDFGTGNAKEWRKFKDKISHALSCYVSYYNRCMIFTSDIEKESAIKQLMPKNTLVRFIYITDKQFELIKNFHKV